MAGKSEKQHQSEFLDKIAKKNSRYKYTEISYYQG